MMRIIKIVTLLIALIVSIWYFFVKDYNYRITFTTSQSPGIVFDHLLHWNAGEPKDSVVLKTLTKEFFSTITQSYNTDNRKYQIKWLLTKENDSTTLVTAKIKDQDNSLSQNFQVLFLKNEFVKTSISLVKNFGENLVENSKKYKISEVIEDTIDSQYCAFIPLKSKVNGKAGAMVKNIHHVMYYLKDNNIELTGDPFLEITDWNINTDDVKYDFCFPIKQQKNFPETSIVQFKRTEEKKALRVDFNGNYKISSMAWYKIIDYAEENNIQLENLPVEVYLNDPHSGGDELKWEANVYIPIKNN